MSHLRLRTLGYAAALALGPAVWANEYSVYNGSIDQPQINVVTRFTETGTPLVMDSYDENLNIIQIINFSAYLDTGASGSLIGNGFFGYTDIDGNLQYAGLYQSPAPIGRSEYPQRLTYTDGNNVLQYATFSDVGATGPGAFHISEPLWLSLGTYPMTDDQNLSNYASVGKAMKVQVGPATVTGDPLLDYLSDIGAVIGMPAMKGKVMVLDNRGTHAQVTEFNATGDLTISGGMKTYLYDRNTGYRPATLDTDLGYVPTSRTVKLSMADFSGYVSTTPTVAPGDPNPYMPDFDHNPFVGPNPLEADNGVPKVQITLNNPVAGAKQTRGSFLLDTGAAVSMISSTMAGQLGVEAIDDGTKTELYYVGPNPGDTPVKIAHQFTIPVQGATGQAEALGFYLDTLLVSTEQGTAYDPNDPLNILYRGDEDLGIYGVPVLVLDIEYESGKTLDGIFGMNLLTGSGDYQLVDFGFGQLMVPVAMNYAPFDWVTFDEQTGILGLEPSAVPEPGAIGAVGLLALVGLRRRRRAALN